MIDRPETLTLKLTVDEKGRIMSKATKMGMTMSAYVRMVLLEKKEESKDCILTDSSQE